MHQARDLQVIVSVDQPWGDRPACQVDHLGRWPGQGQDLLVAAYCLDAPILDGHGLEQQYLGGLWS